MYPILRERVSDVRAFGVAGYALLHQVAHPTVGAGVDEHSHYQAMPWLRLIQTADYVATIVYGSSAAAEGAGRQLREMHKAIWGRGPNGRPYHALEPEAWTWVHATLIDAVWVLHERLGRPIPRTDLPRYYAEWKQLGFIHGVRDGDLPESWDEFRAYFDRMVETRLERTPAVDDLIQHSRSTQPPASWIPRAIWHRLPFIRILRLTSFHLLPPILRERFGVHWTAARTREARIYALAMRASTPLLPEALRVTGPNLLRFLETEAGRKLRSPVTQAA